MKKRKNKNTTKRTTLRSAFSNMERKDNLSKMIANTTEKWFDAKHPKADIDEIEAINDITVDRCPFCGCAEIIRKGRFEKTGIQRYKCKSKYCGKRFNPLTGTLFDSRKIPLSQWIEFFIHMFQLQSIKTSSIDNTNAYSTGKFWTIKLFKSLRHYLDGKVVSGTFWTDETFVSVQPKDLVYKNGKKLPGLSKNKICIFSATNDEQLVMIVGGKGKPSGKRVRDHLLPHISKDAKLMIDDGEKSHSTIVEALGIRREVHLTRETKGLKDKENPMNEINQVHKMFKKFMRAHAGYDRSNLQDWCNLFCFIWNHGGDLPTMVEDMLKLMISTHKVVRFRDSFSKKPING